MSPTERTETFLFWVSLYVPLGIFALGLAVGWFLGKQRRAQALAALVVGGGLLFAGYAGLFAWFGVFDIQNRIR